MNCVWLWPLHPFEVLGTLPSDILKKYFDVFIIHLRPWLLVSSSNFRKHGGFLPTIQDLIHNQLFLRFLITVCIISSLWIRHNICTSIYWNKMLTSSFESQQIWMIVLTSLVKSDVYFAPSSRCLHNCFPIHFGLQWLNS